ncbi:MAG TPA: hypothetical protein VK870_10290 [Ignavibacteriaceae bacterium]|nr:hypothetical protein [Ignavibacteriaceae bacterium]
MNSKNEIQSLQRIVEKDFVDSRFRTLIPNNDFEKLEEFRNYLILKLKDMYEHNYELLLNTLYRIDVSETKLSQLFRSENKDNIHERLADLIIERQLQKIRFRQKYREGKL